MLKIYSDREPVLRQKCSDIELPISDEYKNIAKEMITHLKQSQDPEYSKKHNIRAGIGLAAPQIGLSKRIFAILMEDDDDIHRELVLANPKIMERSIKMCYLTGGEGCLSVNDEHNGLIRRNYKIKIKGYNLLEDKEVLIEAKGYFAIALQHEYDHLDGILFYDRINPFDPFKVMPNDVEV